MPPAHSMMTDSILKFVIGIGLGGGVMWKVMNMTSGENFDHNQGSNNTEQAKAADKLIRRHSTNTHVRDGTLHPEANKAS